MSPMINLQNSDRKVPAQTEFVKNAEPEEDVLLSIYLRRNPNGPPLPTLDHWAGQSPAKRKYLTHEDFFRDFGADKEDIALVSAFLSEQGFTISGTHVNRRLITATGTVAQAYETFGVNLKYYKHEGLTFRSREGAIKIPENLGSVITHVLGLGGHPLTQKRNRFLQAREVESGAPPLASRPLTPLEVAKLYNFPTNKSTGQTIGVIEFQGGYAVDPATGTPNDIKAFLDSLGLPLPKITPVLVDGATNKVEGSAANFSSNDLEVTADIDIAAAIGQGSDIAVYFGPNNTDYFPDVFSAAVHDTVNKPSVITCSWNADESFWINDQHQTQMSEIIAEAASLGVTILVCSMDDGTNCGMNDGKAHVEYPATDPGVICCGGTRINNVNGSNFTEVTWNDGSGQATGGGISTLFKTLPAWQRNAHVPPSINDGISAGRGIPDIAGNASGYSGYTIKLYGQTYVILGTSFVAPLYAGLIARINAALNKHVGFINAQLYQFAGAAGQKVFRDVDDGGNNGVPYQGGISPKYTTGKNWDACTGWGSINGSELLKQLNATA